MAQLSEQHVIKERSLLMESAGGILGRHDISLHIETDCVLLGLRMWYGRMVRSLRSSFD